MIRLPRILCRMRRLLRLPWLLRKRVLLWPPEERTAQQLCVRLGHLWAPRRHARIAHRCAQRGPPLLPLSLAWMRLALW